MSLQHAFRGAGSREVTNKNGANAVLNNEPKKVAGTRTTACKAQASINKHIHTNLHTGRGTGRSPPHRSHTSGAHQCTHGPVSRGTGMVKQKYPNHKFRIPQSPAPAYPGGGRQTASVPSTAGPAN